MIHKCIKCGDTAIVGTIGDGVFGILNAPYVCSACRDKWGDFYRSETKDFKIHASNKDWAKMFKKWSGKTIKKELQVFVFR